MERLTFYDEFGEACYRTKQFSAFHMESVNAVTSNAAIKKLAAYEDTGLTAVEVSKLKYERDEAVSAILDLLDKNNLCADCLNYDKATKIRLCDDINYDEIVCLASVWRNERSGD